MFKRIKKSIAIQAISEKSPNFFDLLDNYGVFRSSKSLTQSEKSTIVMHFDFMERAQIALSVAQMFPGGDYFEFGSDGMGTFRNFLTAFDLVGGITKFPGTEFWAFDIFGNSRSAIADHEYFDSWKNFDCIDKFEMAKAYLDQHALFVDKTKLVRGFFSDTLSLELKAKYLNDDREIGFAFLDCNITNSYVEVFNFLDGLMGDFSYLYMDEYHFNPDVPVLFESFCDRNGFRPYYVRSAGAFGMLYKLNKNER